MGWGVGGLKRTLRDVCDISRGSAEMRLCAWRVGNRLAPTSTSYYHPHGCRRHMYMLGLGCGVYGTAEAIPLREERLTNTTCSE